MNAGPIGVFDSGFGGLTVLKEIECLLPEYDYLYLGDNARSPYGSRSFETVYGYALEAVTWLFDHGCNLVILACNTASAKALRSIQQKDLARMAPGKRVLGVIRPVTETVGAMSGSGHIGIFGTTGTVDSRSYVIEIERYFPQVQVTQEACPIWVPLVETGEAVSEGADFFIRQHIDRLFNADPLVDTVVLGCTHYPLLETKIMRYLPSGVKLVSQGAIVARSLQDYLERHPEMEKRCSRDGTRRFFTSEKAPVFDRLAGLFYGADVSSSEMHW